MSTANLDSADLKGVAYGGLIREDVMNKIWDISNVPLPFTEMIGKTTSKNSYKEWTTDELASPDTTNAIVDGSDASGNNTATGTRVGNHHQISDKVVRVSYRAEASDVIGRTKELAHQLVRRQQELRRDVEAICLVNQASVADDGNSTAGKSGGLPAWIETNVEIPGSGSPAVGGFNTSTGVVDAYTTGVKQTLQEEDIRNVVEAVYNEGGDPSVLMSTPAIIRLISEYLFTSSARVATLMSDQGTSGEKATALGAVNVFVTDFGTLKLVPNRLQQTEQDDNTDTVANVFILDPSYLQLSYLKGYRTDELGKTGLSEMRQMCVDWTLCVLNEKSHGCIFEVDPATAMTA